MELGNCSRLMLPPGRSSVPQEKAGGGNWVASILTDSVLNELKRQAADGCLLCSFDAWDSEEWD